jgi:hypothetical protein
MVDIMTMTGQDGLIGEDLPEDTYADMIAEAREYLYGGLEDVPGMPDNPGAQEN